MRTLFINFTSFRINLLTSYQERYGMSRGFREKTAGDTVLFPFMANNIKITYHAGNKGSKRYGDL